MPTIQCATYRAKMKLQERNPRDLQDCKATGGDKPGGGSRNARMKSPPPETSASLPARHEIRAEGVAER
jgi:hypothetical protein